MKITKVVDFCAAHSIAGAGKCANKHGHNWEATISVQLVDGKLDKRGFIADVGDIKDAAFKYDHDDLDKYFTSASTENVCQRIAKDVLGICIRSNSESTFMVNVHLQETKNNSADAVATNMKVGTLNAGLKGAANNTQAKFVETEKSSRTERLGTYTGRFNVGVESTQIDTDDPFAP